MSGFAARSAALLVLATLALAGTASGGSAASPVHSRILGVVPHAGPTTQARAIGAAGPATLTFDANYVPLINRYFTDVAADSGKTTNVYSVATQYGDGSGKLQYQSTFGGSYVAHDPLPASGCDDGADTYCLTNAQLQDEIDTVLAAKGWRGGFGHMFFLMTPNGVGSCEFPGPVSDANPCSTNFFCAYHSAFGPFDEPIVWANEPYEGPLPRGDCTAQTQGFPNNDVDAETTINTISHEHNEAITDPRLDAWIAVDGNENGDLCAYGFGTPLGGTGATAYNQVINGHHYELQQEYSNQAPVGCAQFLGGPATPPTTGAGPLVYGGGPVMHTNTAYAIYWLPRPGNTAAPVVTGTAAVNHALTSSPGAWNGAPSGFHYQWQRCSTAGAGCAAIPGATGATYKPTSADGGHTMRSTVTATNVNGASTPASSAATAVVIDHPATTKLPHISGRVRAGKKLSGSRGSWTFSPTGYRYQWLRCNGRGTHCSSIRRATHPAYKLTKRDAKHRLRVRVTASNAAGSTTAISKPTARVPAARRS